MPTPAKAVQREQASLRDPKLYVNRELSMMAFQRRVFEEAENPANPILERIKFLAILDSNLDEFFMVRVAGLLAQVDSGSQEVGSDGTSPRAQLSAIRKEVSRLTKDGQTLRDKHLIPELSKAGIHILTLPQLKPEQRNVVNRYFHETIFPVLTPLAFDPGRPFPHISNLSLNLAVVIRGESGEERFARVKIPDTLPQLIPADEKKRTGKTPRQRLCGLKN